MKLHQNLLALEHFLFIARELGIPGSYTLYRWNLRIEARAMAACHGMITFNSCDSLMSKNVF